MNFLSGNTRFCFVVRYSLEALKNLDSFHPVKCALKHLFGEFYFSDLKKIKYAFPKNLAYINVFIYSLGE